MAVTLEIQDNIAIITLSNPSTLNAVTSGELFLLAQYMRSIAVRKDVDITILAGEGKFFSAGVRLNKARANSPQSTEPDTQLVRERVSRSLAHISDVTEAFYSHPKILVAALNGPVIGLSAALAAHADFIYAMPHVYLLAPFSSLGIPAEGGASVVFAQRMGPARAYEALLMSKRIPCEQLLQSGFVNEVFDTGGDRDKFVARVVQEMRTSFGDKISRPAVLQIKELMRRSNLALVASQTAAESFGVVEKLSAGGLLGRGNGTKL